MNCARAILLIVTLLTITCDVQATITPDVQEECTWGEVIHDALQARDVMVANLKAFRDSRSLEKAIDFMLSLDELPSQIADLDDLDLSTGELDERLISIAVEQPSKPIVKDQLRFRNIALETAYNERGLGSMIKTFQNYQNFLCIHALYSTLSSSYVGYELPLDLMCHPLKNDLHTTSTISISKVCTSVSQCSWAQNKADTFWVSQGTDNQNACTSNKCNVAEAVPMMLSLLWYKVSDFIAHSLCYNHLPTPALKSWINSELRNINRMVALLKAYFSTLTWDLFLSRATEVGGFSNIETAMSLVTTHEKSFFSSIKACHELNAQDVCIIEKIYAQYLKLKKMKKAPHSLEQARDLRMFHRINHAKLVELRKKALTEIEVLAMLLKTRSNAQLAASRVSNYFQAISKYDERIAQNDVDYIKAKLDEFTTKSETLSQELEENIKSLLETAITGLLVDQMVNIAEAVNPLGLLTEGPGKNYKSAVKIMKKAQQIAKGGIALTCLADVISDTAKIGADFQGNVEQIPSMTDILVKIQADDAAGINQLASAFIEAYGGYDPSVTRSRLAKNDALWGSFKEAACDLLEGIDAGKLVTLSHKNKQTCQNLEGTLAQFFTLRENIFDFQFELVDKIAAVVRGSIGAQSIMKPSSYQYLLTSKKELFLGYFKTHTRLQTEASTYCSKVEYMNQGQPIDVCKMKNGLFSESDFDELVAYNPEISYHLEERFVYIPTRPQFKGDQGFIDLARLKKGSVTFQPPSNATWLKQFNWLASGEIKAPFVENFKLYLPRKSFSNGYLKTQVTLSSKAFSRVSISSDVKYDLPLENTRYITRYIQNYPNSRCPNGRDIANPYSLCENLPKICDTTYRIPGKSMMPTILTTWELQYSMKSVESNTAHVWDTPDPATDLLVIGKMKLRYLPNAELIKKNVLQSVRNSSPTLGCCTGNQYRPKWNDLQCENCPTEFSSRSKLDGYYCEAQ